MVLEITPKRGLAEGRSPEYLYLPAAERQIERTLLRVGVTALHDAQVRIDWDDLPEKVTEALDMDHLSGDDLPAFNQMCQAIQPLSEADIEKLNAVVLMAEPGDMMAVQQLAENLDQFDFIRNLEGVNWKVDCILTHCAPTSIQQKLDRSYTPDRLTDFLQMVKRMCQFDCWFLGHYHRNCVVDDRFFIQWEQMVELQWE